MGYAIRCSMSPTSIVVRLIVQEGRSRASCLDETTTGKPGTMAAVHAFMLATPPRPTVVIGRAVNLSSIYAAR